MISTPNQHEQDIVDVLAPNWVASSLIVKWLLLQQLWRNNCHRYRPGQRARAKGQGKGQRAKGQGKGIGQRARVNRKFGHICERYSPLKYAWPRFDLSRSLEVKANAAKRKTIYDFLSIINNKFSHICKGYQVTAVWNIPDLDLICQGRSESKTMAPNETSYIEI